MFITGFYFCVTSSRVRPKQKQNPNTNMMNQDPLNFEYGKVRFEIHRSQVEDECDPPLSALPEVVGVHTAAHAEQFPVNANSDLSIIFGEQNGVTLPPVITSDSFRSLMTGMLVSDYLAPWVHEKRLEEIFRTACTLTINLIYDTGLLKHQPEDPRDEIIRGKRNRKKVNYAASKSDNDTVSDSDDGSIFTMDTDISRKKQKKSHGSTESENTGGSSVSEQDSEEEVGGDDVSTESEASLAEEQDLYLFTHERMRAYALHGLDTANDKVTWKTVFNEWWSKCFEQRFMDNPEFYDLIWPRIERINYDTNPHRRKSKNNLDIYIAESMSDTIKTVKNATLDKFPLKATRTLCSVHFDINNTSLTFTFNSGFTQPQPLQKRGKVKDDKNNKHHKVVHVQRSRANPVLLRVTGGGLFHAIKKTVKDIHGINISEYEIQFLTGFGKGRGWFYDVMDMEINERHVEMRYNPDESRTEYSSMLTIIHSRVMRGMMWWGNPNTAFDVTEYAIAKGQFEKITEGFHRLYYSDMEHDQSNKFASLSNSKEVMTFNLIYLYGEVKRCIDDLKEHVGYEYLDKSKPIWERLSYTPHGVQDSMRTLAQLFDITSKSRFDDERIQFCSKGVIAMEMSKVRELQKSSDAIYLLSTSLSRKLSRCAFTKCWETLKNGNKCYPRRSKKLNVSALKTIEDMHEFNKKIDDMVVI